MSIRFGPAGTGCGCYGDQIGAKDGLSRLSATLIFGTERHDCSYRNKCGWQIDSCNQSQRLERC